MARNKIDIDETLQSEFNIRQVARLYKTYIRPHTRDLAVTIALMLISSALSMLTPIILKVIMDDFIPAGNIRGIVLISLGLLLINIIGMYLYDIYHIIAI